MSENRIRSPILAIVAASSGNLVEWYDFYVYSFTAIYFGPVFFPQGDPTSQLLKTAAVFAVGFFTRPLGSWFFGRFADRHGRSPAMVFSVILMALGSLVIALLPGHATVGNLAPAMLLLARMLQGLSVGGEYGISATYMSEVAASGRRGFYSSFQYVTLIGGQLLASLVVLLLQMQLGPEVMKAWGWRIPFFIGALAAVVALLLRRTLVETRTNEHQAEAGKLSTLWRYRRACFTVFGFTACGSLMFYTFTTYMQKYLINSGHMTAEQAGQISTLSLLIFMVVQPAFGLLSDHIGRRPSMLIFSTWSLCCAAPVLIALRHTHRPEVALGLILLALGGISVYTSVSGIVKAELFPPEVRALGVGLCYALGNALCGGTAEYVALWFKNQGNENGFVVYVTIMAAVALGVSLQMPDARKKGYLQS